MKIRYADKNDRKAVYFWLKDPMNQLFIKNHNVPEYNKHCLWFDTMQEQNNLIIGEKDNLRVGFGMLLKKRNGVFIV